MLALAMTAAAAAGVTGVTGVAAADGPVSELLAVTGAVKTPLTLRVDDLKTFPAEHIGSLTTTRRVGDKEMASTVRGVRLTAILDRAALADAGRNDWRHSVVVASATDGYRVTFSWPELFNTDIGAGVLVIFERDGQPLSDREGRIALVSGRDTRTGPRSVHWLNRVDVRVLRD